jgi:hypothetical protein
MPDIGAFTDSVNPFNKKNTFVTNTELVSMLISFVVTHPLHSFNGSLAHI